MIKKAMILLMAVGLAGGCARNSGDTVAVKGVVTEYNRLLADGYRNLNMNPLQAVSTEEVATKAYYHMAALGEGKVRMVSVLKDLNFREISFPTADSAAINTREKWDFSHNDIATGKKLSEEKDFVYEMRYELKKQGSSWKITTIQAVGDDQHGKPVKDAALVKRSRP